MIDEVFLHSFDGKFCFQAGLATRGSLYAIFCTFNESGFIKTSLLALSLQYQSQYEMDEAMVKKNHVSHVIFCFLELVDVLLTFQVKIDWFWDFSSLARGHGSPCRRQNQSHLWQHRRLGHVVVSSPFYHLQLCLLVRLPTRRLWPTGTQSHGLKRKAMEKKIYEQNQDNPCSPFFRFRFFCMEHGFSLFFESYWCV